MHSESYVSYISVVPGSLEGDHRRKILSSTAFLMHMESLGLNHSDFFSQRLRNHTILPTERVALQLPPRITTGPTLDWEYFRAVASCGSLTLNEADRKDALTEFVVARELRLDTGFYVDTLGHNQSVVASTARELVLDLDAQFSSETVASMSESVQRSSFLRYMIMARSIIEDRVDLIFAHGPQRPEVS